MNSEKLAKYIEDTDSVGKSWLLVQLRLQKLAEAKPDLSPEEYKARLEDIYQAMMNLGEWWVGIEDFSQFLFKKNCTQLLIYTGRGHIIVSVGWALPTI
jgi:hypothetical protein